MLKIKLTNLSIAGVVMRFYFAMAVAIALGFMGQFILMSFIPGIIAATAIMGVSFSFGNGQEVQPASRKIIQLDLGEKNMRKAS